MISAIRNYLAHRTPSEHFNNRPRRRTAVTIDYAGETAVEIPAVEPPAVEPSHVDGSAALPDIVIDDLVVLRARINGYGEHRHDIPADAASDHALRLFELMLEAEPSMYAGFVNLEPFLVWAGSDGEELVKAAMGVAQRLVGDASLGIDGPIRDFFWAQVGIASLRRGSWHLGPGRRVPRHDNFFRGALVDVGRRASRLHHVPAPGKFAVDAETRDIFMSYSGGIELEPITMEDDEPGWLVPATSVRGLPLDRMPSD